MVLTGLYIRHWGFRNYKLGQDFECYSNVFKNRAKQYTTEDEMMGSITTLYLHQILGKVGKAKQALFFKRKKKKVRSPKTTTQNPLLYQQNGFFSFPATC